jgi:Fe-S cluster assembly protein SufB
MSQLYTEKVMEHFTSPHNMGDIPDADGIGQDGNPVCLVSGTMIHLNNHFKEIENVQDKERVLTHEGVYSTVERRYVRDYDGPIIRLKNKLGLVEMTPEHLVLAVKRPDQHKFNYTRNKKELNAEWYNVSDHQPRDVAVYPILKVIKDQELFDLDFQKKMLDHRSTDIPMRVPADVDFLRLAGYYLAEGNAVTKVTKAHICFTFHIKEVEYQRDVVKIIKDKFGLDASIIPREETNATKVIVNSANLARVF